MVVALQDFGGNISWRAAQGGGEGFFADDFGEAKVCEFDDEGFVKEKDVFGFDVAVDDVAVVLDEDESQPGYIL